MARIEILCGGGSPDGVHLSDIYGKNGRVGVGGAELALLTMCEGWQRSGHEVVLYNNPKRQDGVFEQRNVEDFDRIDKRGDVVVIFREPQQRVVNMSGCKKVFWSCDQYTTGDFAHFSKFVDKVVTISPCHSRYFDNVYGIKDSVAIDLPVRISDYNQPCEKINHRLIFTSVPDRGLQHVAETFPRIKEQVPSVSLVITSDYRLWGAANPMNNQFVQMFLRMDGVEFLGAVPRERLIQEQLKAQIHYYPFSQNTAEELFCIAVAESQVAAVLPITSMDGALETTNMGIKIPGSIKNPIVQQQFIQTAVENLYKDTSRIRNELREKAIKRFDLNRILNEWNSRVFDG